MYYDVMGQTLISAAQRTAVRAYRDSIPFSTLDRTGVYVFVRPDNTYEVDVRQGNVNIL